ncbi:hypothetical protein Pan241w_26330 [Gimesia alba]|uniref:Uncharacterized protein n=1 Tax=Gimesia alba TaxID=2527973 RepID=A0A517RF97_9PLAN|nr:hypothetical protein [Gimesia alba]QDT42548.1 hypothetical protein Pan241w_26330 [Gimesia alba]
MIQSNTELIDRLKSQLQTLNINSVVIVDNQLVKSLRHDVWLKILAKLREEDEGTLEQIQSLVEDQGITPLESQQPDAIHNEILELISQSESPHVVELIEDLPFGESELDSLVKYINELGLQAKKFYSIDNVPLTESLYFVDYSINETEEMSGQKASLLLERIVEKVSKDKLPPPAIILMSRNQPPKSTWEKVAENGGFLRFCFRYVDKPILAKSIELHSHYLEEVLECLPIGRAYFAQVGAFQESITSAAKSVMKELFQLSPADFRHFAIRRLHDKDSTQSARHLRYLFVRLLESELENSAAVESSLKEYARVLSDKNLRVHGDLSDSMLHQLQAKILYERSELVKTSPITFGDVFEEIQEVETKYYLCITPECDLEIRNEGKAKAEFLLLLEGIPVSKKAEYDYLEYTPLLITNNSIGTQWLEWNFRRPKVVPYEEAAEEKNNLKRWGRMRHEFAERVQQRFASDLLEVGTEETVSGIEVFPTALMGGKNGLDNKGEIKIIRYHVNDQELYAITEEIDDLFDDNPKRSFIPINNLKEFRVLQPKDAFCTLCREHKLFIIQKSDQMAMVWRGGGSLNDWQPPEEWKGYKLISSD